MSQPIDYEALDAFFEDTRDKADKVAMFLDEEAQLRETTDAEARERIEANLKEKKKEMKRIIPSLEAKLDKVASLHTVDGGTIDEIRAKVTEAKKLIFGQAA